MTEGSNASLVGARGVTDEQDRLLSADEPLADLHERCGGSLPGKVAVPELLVLVRQSRQLGLRLAREFAAFDGEELVSGFVRVNPLGETGHDGCEILIENWQRAPLPPDNANEFAQRLDAIDRASAEVTARLDSQQRVQMVSTHAADVHGLRQAIADDPGASWSDYVELVGVAHQQPLHWRLLDGVHCRISGSLRDWRVRLLPLGASNAAPRGFELLLIANEPLAIGNLDATGEQDDHAALVTSALTPVLRQPIARIIANAETIRARLAGPLRAEYSEYAGNIASAGKHLSAMLDDLTDLEVVEAPDFSTSRERVDLGDAARRAAGILGVRARDKSIKINLPTAIEQTAVIGEFRRVLQILINLIGNAIAYSPEGSTVEVSISRKLDQTVDLVISDQGPGMDEEQAMRAFDKFERLGRDNDGGSGLGLYISRKLARAMEGDLSLDSSAEEGARFVLTLPLAD